MATKKIVKSFSLTAEVVELIDSCKDKTICISRVVDSLLLGYFKQDGNIPEVLEKNKERMVAKEKTKLNQYKEVFFETKGNMDDHMNKYWKKEMGVDEEEFENIKKMCFFELNAENEKSNEKKGKRIKTYD